MSVNLGSQTSRPVRAILDGGVRSGTNACVTAAANVECMGPPRVQPEIDRRLKARVPLLARVEKTGDADAVNAAYLENVSQSIMTIPGYEDYFSLPISYNNRNGEAEIIKCYDTAHSMGSCTGKLATYYAYAGESLGGSLYDKSRGQARWVERDLATHVWPICFGMIKCVQVLHDHHMTHNDLHLSNFVVMNISTPVVRLIDFDMTILPEDKQPKSEDEAKIVLCIVRLFQRLKQLVDAQLSEEVASQPRIGRVSALRSASAENKERLAKKSARYAEILAVLDAAYHTDVLGSHGEFVWVMQFIHDAPTKESRKTLAALTDLLRGAAGMRPRRRQLDM